jgi:hypothetical protein
VSSQFPTFVSHLSSAFLRAIRLMVLATQLTAVLQADPRLLATVSVTFLYVPADAPDQVHRLFRSESVTSLVDSLCIEAIGGDKS